MGVATEMLPGPLQKSVVLTEVVAESPRQVTNKSSVVFIYYLFIYLFIFLFIYFWLCWVFVAVRRLSLVAASADYSLLR